MQLDMFNMFRFQRSVWVWSATSLGVSAKRNIIQIYLLIRVGKVQWRWAVQYAWSHHEKAPAIYVQWEKSKSIPVSGVPLREFGLWRIWRLRFTNCWLPTPQLLPHLLSTIQLGEVTWALWGTLLLVRRWHFAPCCSAAMPCWVDACTWDLQRELVGNEFLGKMWICVNLYLVIKKHMF